MSSIMYILSKRQQEQGLLARLIQRVASWSEICWFITSLLLFMLLGPFSAVIVVVALFSIAGQKQVKEMNEPTAKQEANAEMSA